MSKNKSVLANVGTMAALTISSKLVRLVILMVTARFLTPEDFGITAAFAMVFGFAYLVADMGIIRTIIQRPFITDKHIGSALTLSVSLSVIVFLSLSLSSAVIADLLTINEINLPLKISAFMFLLLGVSNVCSALFQRNGDILFIGKVQALGTIVGNIFVTLPLLYFDIGFWSIIIGLWVSELISVLFILLKGRGYLRYKAYRKESIEIVQYATAFFFNNTIGLVSQQIDIAVVSRFMGAAALGNYSRGMQLVEFPNQIYWLVVDRVIFPVMSAMKDEKEKLSEFFLQSLAMLSLVLTIGTLILIIGSHEIVLIMMGGQWTVVADLLQILAGCIIFRALASFMDSFLAAYDLVKVLTLKQIVSLLLLLLSIWLGMDYGVNGVAYAVVMASGLRFVLTLILIIMDTRVTALQLIKGFIPGILSGLIPLIIYFLISEFLGFTGLWCILACVVVFAGGCVIKPSSLLLSEKGKRALLQQRARYINFS
jgi:O-antigen/teichoic acid export membrane protein